MWNAQISALALGASVICYDGSPTFPDAAAMWTSSTSTEVTFFGTSPGYLLASQDRRGDLDQRVAQCAAAAMGSTGSPLSPDIHRWHKELPGVPCGHPRRYRRMQRVHRRRPDGPGAAGRAVGAVPGVGGGVLGSRAGAGSRKLSGPNGDGEEVPNAYPSANSC